MKNKYWRDWLLKKDSYGATAKERAKRLAHSLGLRFPLEFRSESEMVSVLMSFLE